MSKIKQADSFLSGLESKLSLVTMLWGIPAAIASFALPAWAVRGARVFEAYAPASWVAAGFLGLLAGSTAYALTAWALGKRVRARYDARMLASGGAVDPLAKIFERKRIYINEFCLPSHPLVEDKTFIDCEIIGPANILFVSGNNINQAKYPVCDAIWLKAGAAPNSNCYLFVNCTFRGCNFSRITFLVPFEEVNMFKGYGLVKWITQSPYDQPELPLTDYPGDEPTLLSSPEGADEAGTARPA